MAICINGGDACYRCSFRHSAADAENWFILLMLIVGMSCNITSFAPMLDHQCYIIKFLRDCVTLSLSSADSIASRTVSSRMGLAQLGSCLPVDSATQAADKPFEDDTILGAASAMPLKCWNSAFAIV
jgi:hypothetical protein